MTDLAIIGLGAYGAFVAVTLTFAAYQLGAWLGENDVRRRRRNR